MAALDLPDSSRSEYAARFDSITSSVANIPDVMCEQLDYLLTHIEHGLHSDCAECYRYMRVQAILLEIFF